MESRGFGSCGSTEEENHKYGGGMKHTTTYGDCIGSRHTIWDTTTKVINWVSIRGGSRRRLNLEGPKKCGDGTNEAKGQSSMEGI
jgi:hypothetical protein